jgi:hypothetical protein
MYNLRVGEDIQRAFKVFLPPTDSPFTLTDVTFEGIPFLLNSSLTTELLPSANASASAISVTSKIKELTLPRILVPKVVRNLKATHSPPLD